MAETLVATVEVAVPEGLDLLEGNGGAFVNVAASGVSEASFLTLIIDGLTELGFSVTAIEDVEFAEERLRRKPPPEDLQSILRAAEEEPSKLAVGSFFSYPKHND